jgi:predicted nucleotidyltransferase
MDVLVRPGRAFSLVALQQLQSELAALVGRRVEIVPEDSVPRDVLARMRSEAITL